MILTWPSRHTARIIVYGILAVLCLWLLLWTNVKSKKVNEQAKQTITSFRQELDQSFKAYAKSSQLSAIELTQRGLDLTKQNPALASIVLEAASVKDPKLRDTALAAGYAELASAETLWSYDSQAAKAHTEAAQKYLEQAQSIDPIYAKTYELLAIAYTNLGLAEKAAEATQKAKTFAVSS